MSELKIFVSSTCYDLTQIRTDLEEYLINAGHRPILSDAETFPIDPDIGTLENCLSNVESCDIFILIIGHRYGYVTNEGISITHSEYLYAKKLQKPIYIFINKPLITMFGIWQGNKDIEYSHVDSTKVFEFVEEVREKDKKWCFQFEKAQDVKSILKLQFSNLLKRTLDKNKRFAVNDIPKYFDSLSPEAINIALKKGELYEARFFSQLLKDEIDKYESLKLDLDFRIIYSSNNMEINNREEFIDWTTQNLLPNHLITSISNLYQQAYPLFYGIPGQPSDLKGLYYVAHSIAKIFMEMIKWCIRIRSTEVGDEYLQSRDDYADILSTPINQLWVFCQTNLTSIDKLIEEAKKSGETNIMNTLDIDLNYDALERFKKGLGV